MIDIMRDKSPKDLSPAPWLRQVRNTFKEFIDIIYPPACAVCQKYLDTGQACETLICHDCLGGFHEIHSPFCTICRKPFSSISEENHPCENCIRKRPHYRQLFAPYLYEGKIMDAIHAFKYAGKRDLGKNLGSLLASYALKSLNDMSAFLVMPVPLHPARLRERGFNQSLILAREVSKILGNELDFLSLRRVKYTSPQTTLKRPERRKNVRNAFELRTGKETRGRDILLVDDVATTGSTLNECAKLLEKHNCNDILCLVLARTGINS